ncbi:MAG: DMT family transporter [Ignavibacteriales bacterium]|nr:DMT family transporter [Ignavibacteriales bacterium]
MPFIGELCGLLTAVCWSGSSLAFSAATLRVGPIRLNVTRLIFAAALLFVAVVITGSDIHLSSSQLRNLVISGIIGLVIGDTFLFKSYEIIGARMGMLIMSVAPAISALLAYVLLGEILSWMAVLGMVVTLLGIAIVVFERRETITGTRRSHFQGIVFGFLAAAGQGVALVMAKMAFNEGPINGFVATLVRIVSSTIVIWPLAWIAGKYDNAYSIFMKDRKALWLTLLGAFLGPFLGITLSLVSVANTTVGIAATLMATVPILMLPLVKYIQKDHISWRAIVGATIAVGGVAILFMR